jgi:Pyridine nucleotide-disulphide oxidoreductase
MTGHSQGTPARSDPDRTAPRIVIVGGGYVGMYTVLRLRRMLRRSGAQLCIIDPKSYMTYQPFLAEAAAGNLAERHVVVPLRQVLRGVEILNGRVTAISHAQRQVEFVPVTGEARRIGYDILVVALGSISRTLPIEGLAERGIGFKTVGEAIYLRNHVLSQLDLAASTEDPDTRRKALTFVFVGAEFAGVEALAELEDMARSACRYYPGIAPDDMRWILVEAWTFRNKSSFRRIASGRYTRHRFAAFTQIYPIRAVALALSRVVSAPWSRDREDLTVCTDCQVFAIMKSPSGRPGTPDAERVERSYHIRARRHAGNSP